MGDNKPGPMSRRQRRFVQEYLVDFNGWQAAIRAGYERRSARNRAYVLLRRAEVKKAVEEGMAEIIRRTGITQDRVVREYARIAFADIGDFVKVQEGRRPVVEIPPGADTACIAELTETEYGTRLKLHDKIAALRDLARHLGLFREKPAEPEDVPVVHLHFGEEKREGE